jgi:probable phosphoglycerate mutase
VRSRPFYGVRLEAIGRGRSHRKKIADHAGTDLMDADIGKWQGKSWKVLSLTKVWKIVQHSPSRFRFPEGESFPEIQTRISGTLEKIIKKHNKPQDIVAVVFHADPISVFPCYRR